MSKAVISAHGHRYQAVAAQAAAASAQLAANACLCCGGAIRRMTTDPSTVDLHGYTSLKKCRHPIAQRTERSDERDPLANPDIAGVAGKIPGFTRRAQISRRPADGGCGWFAVSKRSLRNTAAWLDPQAFVRTNGYDINSCSHNSSGTA